MGKPFCLFSIMSNLWDVGFLLKGVAQPRHDKSIPSNAPHGMTLAT
jgi:hypothetical protein